MSHGKITWGKNPNKSFYVDSKLKNLKFSGGKILKKNNIYGHSMVIINNGVLHDEYRYSP